MLNVYFDSVNLNADPYRVIDFPHESPAQEELNAYPLARERGAVVIEGDYGPKQFTVSGILRGSSIADLDSKRNTMLELFSRKGKNLDVDYSGGTLRYSGVYIIARSIERGGQDATLLRWKVTFLCPSGIGINTTPVSSTISGITAATYNGNVTIDGSAPPRPLVTVTFSAVTGSPTQISLQAGGNKVDMSGVTIAAASVIVFDCENKKVTLDGVEKEYTGFFPEFVIGVNAYTIIVNGTTRTYSVKIDYSKSYF